MAQFNQEQTATQTGGTLERIFGGVAAKVLDFLAESQTWDFSKQDIAKSSGVSIRHAILALEKLEKAELVKHTRKVGHNHMYKYNTENKTAVLLEQFSMTWALQECQKLATEQLNIQEPLLAVNV
jgi:DNA-binding transcriptional regulator GbsR (MarR family)